jgi:hypothetical protein
MRSQSAIVCLEMLSRGDVKFEGQSCEAGER